MKLLYVSSSLYAALEGSQVSHFLSVSAYTTIYEPSYLYMLLYESSFLYGALEGSQVSHLFSVSAYHMLPLREGGVDEHARHGSIRKH